MPKARESPRKIVIASTATGIDAETVIPTFKNRYNDDAPKMIPSREPRATAENVSSGNWAWRECTAGMSSCPVRPSSKSMPRRRVRGPTFPRVLHRFPDGS